ncbi:hypothetical protein FACS189421_14610 [Bacteroidia bacterium]|nr:hypothetical protein FACS189421_14610 [Bacteroidia bacterium]GHT45232.1 hypothetical protein FACS189440_00820 [Bacteroidia bacterium]
MKVNKNLFFILFVSVICLGFTACNNDDDKQTDYAHNIVANYTGTLSGASEVPIPATIAIEHSAPYKVNLKLNQTIAGLPINITCPTDVIEKDGKYSLSGNTTIDLPLGENGAPVSIPVEVTGNVTVTTDAVISAKVALITIKVGNAALQAVVPVFPLTVVFSGAAPLI